MSHLCFDSSITCTTFPGMDSITPVFKILVRTLVPYMLFIRSTKTRDRHNVRDVIVTVFSVQSRQCHVLSRATVTGFVGTVTVIYIWKITGTSIVD